MTAASLTFKASAHSTRSLTALYFASFIALGLSTGSLGPTLLTLASQTNSSISSVSYLFTLRSLGYVCGSLRGGRLFDQYQGNLVMGVLLLAGSLCLTAVANANSFTVLLALMFALGVVEAGIDVGANTLLVRVHRDRVAPFLSAMHAFFGVGALVAPLIVAAISSPGQSSSQAYVLISLLFLPIACGAFGFQSPGAIESDIIETRSSHMAPALALFVIFFCLYVGAEVGFGGWIFTYAVTTNIGSAATAAFLTSLFWAALTIGRLVVIPLTSRLRAEPIIVGTLSCAVLSLLAMLMPFRSLALLAFSTGVLGFSMGPIFPVTLSFAARRMNVTGRVTGWFVVGASLGATILPLLIGQLLNSAGPRSTIVVPLIAMSGAIGTFALINQKSNTTHHV